MLNEQYSSYIYEGNKQYSSAYKVITSPMKKLLRGMASLYRLLGQELSPLGISALIIVSAFDYYNII
jgi:hypothetical protein